MFGLWCREISVKMKILNFKTFEANDDRTLAAAAIHLHKYICIIQLYLFDDSTSFWFGIDSQNIVGNFGMTQCWKWNFNISTKLNSNRNWLIVDWIVNGTTCTYTLYPDWFSAIILFNGFFCSNRFTHFISCEWNWMKLNYIYLTCFDFVLSLLGQAIFFHRTISYTNARWREPCESITLNKYWVHE